MPSDVGSWFQQGPGNSGSSVGQVSDQPLTFTNRVALSVTNVSAELFAGATGVAQQIIIAVPASADTGVHIHFGAGSAVTTDLLLGPGFFVFPTTQRIAMIRAGAANVTVYWATAVV